MNTMSFKKHPALRRRACALFAVVLVAILLIWIDLKIYTIVKYTEYDISCYRDKDEHFSLVAGVNYKFPEKNIFFLITSCTGRLDYRQACAVESAARANPAWQVSVLFTGPISRAYRAELRRTNLTAIPNLKFVRLDVERFIAGSPVEHIFRNGSLERSLWPAVHVSDVLKWAVLSRHGGIYLDSRVVVVRELESHVPTLDCAGADWDAGADHELRRAGDTLLALTTHGVGKIISDFAIEQLSRHFEPQSYEGSGPELLVRALHRVCSTRDHAAMNVDTCQGFHLLDKRYLYPIPYEYWSTYLTAGSAEFVARLAHAALAHSAWFGVLAGAAARPDLRGSIYASLAQEHCPAVYDYYKVDYML